MTTHCELHAQVVTANEHRSRLYQHWSDMGGWRERNELPETLWDLYAGGSFTIGETKDGYPIYDTALLAVAVEDAWSGAEYPQSSLDAHEWLDLFFAGGPHLVKPDQPVTLYRGVRDEAWANGMSWTGSLEVARWFADRNVNGAGSGAVFRLVDVDPGAVLAQITHGRSGENEYVLDFEHLGVLQHNGRIELYEDRNAKRR